jgi:hypothetical protein
MRCDEVRPLISVGLDGELAGDLAARVRAHLEGCPGCAAEREALSATVRLLRALPEAEPPVDLRCRIAAAVLAEECRASRPALLQGWLARPRTAGWAWGAAFGAAAATLALVLTHGPAPSRPVAAVLPTPALRPPVPRAPTVPTASRLVPVRPALNSRTVVRAPISATIHRPLPTPTPAANQAAPALLPLQRPEPSPAAPVDTNPPPATRPTAARGHRGRVRPVPVRHRGPVASRHAAPGPAHPEPRADIPPRLASTDPASAPPPSSTERPDPLDGSDTSQMMQMASGPADMTEPMPASDDLSELRRQLIDRPLQAPQLGELKHSDRSHTGRDGWIRF